MSAILASMLEEFDGFDGGDPGSPSDPSIWLLGIEPGYSIQDELLADSNVQPVNDGYSIERQLTWRFNQNAFKLLAAIEGNPVSDYKAFAQQRRPFEAGSKGYFKGNLYPYACTNVEVWPQVAADETGFRSKSEYQEWCRHHRWRAIAGWVNKYCPKLIVAAGNSFRNDFSAAVFGEIVELKLHGMSVNGVRKNIYYRVSDGKRLVVIPHLSRGLHENEALQKAGEFIAGTVLNLGDSV